MSSNPSPCIDACAPVPLDCDGLPNTFNAHASGCGDLDVSLPLTRTSANTWAGTRDYIELCGVTEEWGVPNAIGLYLTCTDNMIGGDLMLHYGGAPYGAQLPAIPLGSSPLNLNWNIPNHGVYCEYPCTLVIEVTA